MNDNNKIKFAGRLKSYMIWPILLSLLLIAMNVVMYFIQVTAGIWFTVCVGIYVVIVLSMYFRSRPKIMNEIMAHLPQSMVRCRSACSRIWRFRTWSWTCRESFCGSTMRLQN